jgi:hypothetical protein
LGVERIVGVSLALARSLLDAALPGKARAILAQSARNGLSENITHEIVQHIPNAGDYSTESFDYVRRMLRLRERPSDRWRYTSRLLFTPSLGEWAWGKLPEPLFPLYRGVRLLRVGGRLIGIRE